MPNPYHDSEGKFTSREGMLKEIDRLAISGQVDAYIKLREDFDKIDAERTVILTIDEFNALQKPVAEKENKTLSEIHDETNTVVVNLDNLSDDGYLSIAESYMQDWETREENGLVNSLEKIEELLERSNYNQSAVYALVESGSPLPYKAKLDILKKANYLEGYAYMHNFVPSGEDAKAIMAFHEPELVEAAQRMLNDRKIETYPRNRLADLIGRNSKIKENIKLAVELTDFNTATGRPGCHIIDNPEADAQTVSIIVNKIVDAKDVQTYWSARESVKQRLKAKGITLTDRVLNPNVEPLPGKVDERTIREVARTAPKVDSNGRQKPQTWEESEARNKALSRFDSYSENLQQLKKDVKNQKVHMMDRAMARRRLENAITYLNMLQDRNDLMKLIEKL